MKKIKMKKLFVFIAILSLLTISATPGVAQSHPYLFFTKDRVKTLSEQVKKDSKYKEAYADIERVAQNALKEKTPFFRMDYLSLAYLMSKDTVYLNKIKDCIRTMKAKGPIEASDPLDRKYSWTSTLATATVNFHLGLGFDAVYNDLTAVERKELAQNIYNLGIRSTWNEWVSPETRIHAINSMGHNFYSSCIGMMGIASMSVVKEIPEVRKYIDKAVEALTGWAKFPGDVVHNKPCNFDKGAYCESINYANYATAQYLYFRLALKNFDPNREWPEKEYLTRVPEFYMNTCYPSDHEYLSSLYFGDSNLPANGEAVVKLLWALGVRNQDMLWYLSQVRQGQHKESMPFNTPMGILYSPDLSGCVKTPSLPLSASYDVLGWGCLRNTWQNNGTMLGVKCGHTWNHSHADAGSFILFHNGEQIIKDAGNCGYGNPLYGQYYFQSPAHNVLMFDGKAQPQEQEYKGSQLDGTLNHLLDAGNIKYLLANVTGPTSHYFAKNHRSFLWIDDVILIIDDMRTYDYGTFSFLLHPDGKSKKQGIDISITKGESSVLVRPLWPNYLNETDFEHDFPNNLKLKSHQGVRARVPKEEMETYYSIVDSELRNRSKFIVAVILKESPSSKDYPRVSRITGDDLQGVRIEKGDKVTDVYLNVRADGHIMHRNSCTEINGYETDAYLLAYSYKKGDDIMNAKNISEWFIGHGSYLRTSKSVLFDSFDKKFVVIKGKDKIYSR